MVGQEVQNFTLAKATGRTSSSSYSRIEVGSSSTVNITEGMGSPCSIPSFKAPCAISQAPEGTRTQ